MPLDTVEPIILTITTEDKNSQKDEIVLQYNPDGEEKLEKLTENHDKHDYVTVDVPGMNLAINVSSSLTAINRAKYPPLSYTLPIHLHHPSTRHA